MKKIMRSHKKTSVVILTLIFVILLTVYIRAVFLPGIWHYEAFLYLRADGSFSGSDMYGEYAMSIVRGDSEADITFSVNDIMKNYHIIYSDIDMYKDSVEIYDDEQLIFKGTANDVSGLVLLEDESGQIVDFVRVNASGVVPRIEELFPGVSKLYHLAVSDDLDRRGNPVMLLFILLIALILIIDIVWKDFFFILAHGIEVDGGTPSDYYRFMQMVGRVALVAFIFVLLIMTFTKR